MIFCDLERSVEEGEIYAHFGVSIASMVGGQAIRRVQGVQRGLCSRNMSCDQGSDREWELLL